MTGRIALSHQGRLDGEGLPMVKSSEAHRAVEAIWRIESSKIIAALARRVRDIGLAEELAQDALVAALERWPEQGIPDNPGAWLLVVAKRRFIAVSYTHLTLPTNREV